MKRVIVLLIASMIIAFMVSGTVLGFASPVSPVSPIMAPSNACEQAMIDACNAGTEIRCTEAEIRAWCQVTGVTPTPTVEMPVPAPTSTMQPMSTPVSVPAPTRPMSCDGVYIGLWMGRYPLYETSTGYCVIGGP